MIVILRVHCIHFNITNPITIILNFLIYIISDIIGIFHPIIDEIGFIVTQLRILINLLNKINSICLHV